MCGGWVRDDDFVGRFGHVGIERTRQRQADQRTDQLCGDERRRRARRNSREAVGEHPSDCHCRIGEGSRTREPVGGPDIGTHRRGSEAGPASSRKREYQRDQSRCRDDLTEEVARRHAFLRRDFEDSTVEHGVGKPSAAHCAEHLDADVGKRIAPSDTGTRTSTEQPICRCHSRIEVGAGDRTEHEDEYC